MSSLTDQIIEVSNHFGTAEYSRAGGGNASVKVDGVLWIKPSGVPLLTLERLMFRFVGAGFVLLTLTVVVGAFFGEHIYGASHTGWRWDHKRTFTVLSWLTFAALLIGRWRLGWRGRRAVRVLYAGAALLLA